MSSFLRSGQRSRAIIAVIAATWLPYISTRCLVEPPGCPVSVAVHDDAPSSPRAHPQGPEPSGHQDHESGTANDPRGDHHHSANHTCCELTGKYAYMVASAVPSVAPAAVLVTIPGHARVAPSFGSRQAQRPTPGPAHHPPPYLRFLTLLI